MKRLTPYLISVLLGALHTVPALSQTCNDSIPASAPNSRYEVLTDDSEVLDKQTQLVWQRCSIGHSWDGAACTGTAAQYNWKDALAAAESLGNGYRLPNFKELFSLVEAKCFDPAINTDIFPDTLNFYFWSSSPYLDVIEADNSVWCMNFQDGQLVAGCYKGAEGLYVRAVRANR